MNHLDAIIEIKNVISDEFIKRIIYFIDNKAKKNLTIRGSVINKNIRNVKGYPLSFNTPTDLFYWNYVKKEIEKTYFYYKAKFPLMESNRINQIDLLKYTSPGGKYEMHTDSYSSASRELSISMNLNDDYEGGDFIFGDQRHGEIKRFKLSKGSVLFFPSNFMYPHSVQPITKGTRYSIVAWLQ